MDVLTIQLLGNCVIGQEKNNELMNILEASKRTCWQKQMKSRSLVLVATKYAFNAACSLQRQAFLREGEYCCGDWKEYLEYCDEEDAE